MINIELQVVIVEDMYLEVRDGSNVGVRRRAKTFRAVPVDWDGPAGSRARPSESSECWIPSPGCCDPDRRATCPTLCGACSSV